VVFTGDVKQRLDDVIGPGFCAVASSSVGIDDVMRLDDALAPLGGRAVRVRRSQDRTLPTRDGGDVVECDDLMTEWLASLDRSIAIARPDHGVYGTAATADEALDLLNRIVSSYGTANSAAETG
jgi:hypothetical protein